MPKKHNTPKQKEAHAAGKKVKNGKKRKNVRAKMNERKNVRAKMNARTPPPDSPPPGPYLPDSPPPPAPLSPDSQPLPGPSHPDYDPTNPDHSWSPPSWDDSYPLTSPCSPKKTH